MLASGVTPPSPRHVRHAVQFYDRDAALARIVGDYLTEGIADGGAGLIVATTPHRAAITEHLHRNGLDVYALTRDRRLRFFDAAETLSKLLVGGWPDPSRFTALLSLTLDGMPASIPVSGLRAYGEMVDLLWGMGNRAAALELETLWHAAIDRHGFSVLCSYATGGFSEPADAAAFLDVCDRHDRIWPNERGGIRE